MKTAIAALLAVGLAAAPATPAPDDKVTRIEPIYVDAERGMALVWTRDLVLLVQMNNAKADEIERLKKSCSGRSI